MSEANDAPPPVPAPRPPPRSAVLQAAAFYFAMVFAVGLVLGPVRVLWLEPWIGTTLAVLCEAPLLILAMWFAASAAPSLARMEGGWPSYLTLGVMALVLQQVADLAVGFGLRGMTFTDQAAYFATPAGMIYAVTLVIFALTPVARWFSRRRVG